MEEQKVEERINSKSTQLEIERNCCTGYTGGAVPVHPKATGYTGALAPVHPDSAARPGWKILVAQDTPVTPWPSTGLFTMLSFREYVLGVRNFASAPVTLVAWIGSTGALTVVMIRDTALGFEENPSAPITPVPQRSMHRCMSVKLSQCQIVNGYYLVLVWLVTPVLPLRSIRCLWLSGQFLSNG